MSPTKMLSAAGFVAVCLAIAAGVAWAGSRGCVSFLGFPILVWCAVLAFAVFVVLIPVAAAEESIDDAINRVYERKDETALAGEKEGEEVEELRDLIDMTDEAPVIRWVNNLFYTAVKERASDIHIEPFEDRIRIRYRIDGVLYETMHPPLKLFVAFRGRGRTKHFDDDLLAGCGSVDDAQFVGCPAARRIDALAVDGFGIGRQHGPDEHHANENTTPDWPKTHRKHSLLKAGTGHRHRARHNLRRQL